MLFWRKNLEKIEFPVEKIYKMYKCIKHRFVKWIRYFSLPRKVCFQALRICFILISSFIWTIYSNVFYRQPNYNAQTAIPRLHLRTMQRLIYCPFQQLINELLWRIKISITFQYSIVVRSFLIKDDDQKLSHHVYRSHICKM